MAIRGYKDRATRDIAAGVNSKAARRTLPVELHEQARRRLAFLAKYTGDFPISVHPGEVLREMLGDRGITQLRLARHLDTDVARINEICRRRRGISAQMAVLLAKALGTSPGLWPYDLGPKLTLDEQRLYDR